MYSLNDVAKFCAENTGGGLSRFESVTYDFDPGLPMVYDSPAGSDDLRLMIFELLGELKDAKLCEPRLVSKARIGTLFVDELQVLIIDHDGPVIPDDVLSRLNSNFEKIASGLIREGRVTGNVRAAIRAKNLGGRISIQNHPDEDYRVDTTAVLPVPR